MDCLFMGVVCAFFWIFIVSGYMELLTAYEMDRYMTAANDNRQSILHDLFDASEESIIRSMVASKGLHIQAMNSCRMVDMLVEYEDRDFV